MKIIYATDIHGSFSQVYNLLRETIADVYILSGDLLDMPFYSMDVSVSYFELQSRIMALKENTDAGGMSLEDFAADLVHRTGIEDEERKAAEEYIGFTGRAVAAMEQKYRILENILSSKPHAMVLTIPGNCDIDLESTALAGRNMHLRSVSLEGLIFAGYGGSDVFTPGFPQKHAVLYRGDGRGSELYQFLKKANPAIIMAHHPANGVFDRQEGEGHRGSRALRDFCDGGNVLICCTGHIHDDWGIALINGTLYLNPSNFGSFPGRGGGISDGGLFYEAEVNSQGVRWVMLRRLQETRVYDLARYLIEDAVIREEAIDSVHLQSAREPGGMDPGPARYEKIPELRIFRDIRNFFRIYQTRETEERIERMQLAIDMLGDDSSRVAADMVGSVNLGVAQPSSDIDCVIYLKAGEDAVDDELTAMMESYLSRIRGNMPESIGIQVIDVINLDAIIKSIRDEDCDCMATQLFAAYRSICRPVNYRVISPVEDLLNCNIQFRESVEIVMQQYLQAFTATSDVKRSFDKYQTRIKSMGVRIPDAVLQKIRAMLQID